MVRYVMLAQELQKINREWNSFYHFLESHFINRNIDIDLLFIFILLSWVFVSTMNNIIITGNGLLISSGEHWRSHRKLIAPAFHQFVLKSFVGAFNRNSWRLVKRLQEVVGREFDVHDYMSEVTVDILLGKGIHFALKSTTIYRLICIFFVRNCNGSSKNSRRQRRFWICHGCNEVRNFFNFVALYFLFQTTWSTYVS